MLGYMVTIGAVSYIWVIVMSSTMYSNASKIKDNDLEKLIAIVCWLFVIIRPLIFCSELYSIQPGNPDAADRSIFYSGLTNIIFAGLATIGHFWIRHKLGKYKQFEIEQLRLEENERNRTALEEAERKDKEYQLFLQSPEYQYIPQFAKKYGTSFDEKTLSKLKLLISDRWSFSNEELESFALVEVERQIFENVISKLTANNPKTIKEYIHNFLSFYQNNDEEKLKILFSIVKQQNIYHYNFDDLKKNVVKISKDIEAEHFRRQLLDDSNFTINDIDELSGYEFESFLKELFTKMGYEVEQTKLSGDQGADLVVIKFGEITVIQAKRFGGKVGNYAVQEILAAISLYKAQKGMVITNNLFTPAAIELAKANNIELIDREKLKNLIQNHW